jgi:heterodisulfide reductase subunit A2
MINNPKNRVAIIGAGVAGISAAIALKHQGITADIFEKENKPGGHLQRWHALFPGRDDASVVLNEFNQEIISHEIKVQTGSTVTGIHRNEERLTLTFAEENHRDYEAIIVANGFTLFDATRKEEYGYGIYPNVITSADLEDVLHIPEKGLLKDGKPPQRVAFVHCVGSRDAKVGNHYCSKVCCITGVKQAITVKEHYPECEVLNFYMDLRMFGSGYEELYQEAQENFGINFIRGRVSEAAPTLQGTIQVKAEDTLMGRPLKITVDWLILLIGMEPGEDCLHFSESTGLQLDSAGFFEGKNKFLLPGHTSAEGIFIAGTCGGPASIPASVNQGRAAADSAFQYLQQKSNNK